MSKVNCDDKTEIYRQKMYRQKFTDRNLKTEIFKQKLTSRNLQTKVHVEKFKNLMLNSKEPKNNTKLN